MRNHTLPFIVSAFLLSSVSALGGITHNYYLEISPASVKLLDQKKPDKDFSETDLSNLRMLVRNIAAAHALKETYTRKEKAFHAVLLFRHGFLYGVLANFMRQQFEKAFWRFEPEMNPLKNIIPVVVSFAAMVVIQTQHWFAEAPQAESTLMKRLNLSRERVLEKFEPFEHETYAITCLLVAGCQIKARHLLYRLHRSGWFPGKVSVHHDHMFP